MKEIKIGRTPDETADMLKQGKFLEVNGWERHIDSYEKIINALAKFKDNVLPKFEGKKYDGDFHTALQDEIYSELGGDKNGCWVKGNTNLSTTKLVYVVPLFGSFSFKLVVALHEGKGEKIDTATTANNIEKTILDIRNVIDKVRGYIQDYDEVVEKARKCAVALQERDNIPVEIRHYFNI